MIASSTLQLAFIGNFGGGEIILIFLIVLLLFGAKKVPELFRSLGKGVNEFRKAKSEWESDINDVMNQEPLEDHDFKKKNKTLKILFQQIPNLRSKKSKQLNILVSLSFRQFQKYYPLLRLV